MTSLAEALAAHPPIKPGTKCTVAVVLDQLPPADRDLLAAEIAGTRSSNMIARACRDADIALKIHPIARHRRGDCDCPKVAK